MKSIRFVYRLSFLLVFLFLCSCGSSSDNSAPAPTPTPPARWTTNGPDAGQIFSIIIDPVSPNILYAGTAKGIWKSSDRGNSWTILKGGLPDLAIVTALAVAPSNPNILYAALVSSDFLLAKSTDGGQNWTVNSGDAFTAFSVHPTNPNIVYGSLNPGGVSKSTDGGQSWTSTDSSVAGGLTNLVKVDPATPDIVYASTITMSRYFAGGFYRSTDGGDHWIKLSAFGSGNLISDVEFDPTNPDVVYVLASGFFYRSSDEGQTWTPLANTGDLSALYFLWLEIDPINPGTMYGVTNRNGVFNGILKSVDGGTHWTDITDGLPSVPIKIEALAVDPVSGSFLYAGSDGGWVYRITVGH